ncbi:hypothetical protein [Methylosinus trichosporium]|nr:hypothetical protein [Methylosinus trichosporium]
MDQVYRSPENGKFERIEAAKILAYQALENIEVDAFSIAGARIDKALGWVPELPDEYGVAKTSRYQSRISLLYVRYLLDLFQDNAAAVDKDLRLIFESAGFVKECPIAAYNLTLALLSAGLIASGRGDVAGAQTAWSKVIELFRAAAASMPSIKPATFTELTVALDAAKQASWALEELRIRRSIEKNGLTPEKLAREFSRLRNGNACSFMAQRLRSVIAQGAAPAAPPPKKAVLTPAPRMTAQTSMDLFDKGSSSMRVARSSMVDERTEIFDGAGIRVVAVPRNSPGLLVVSFTGRDHAPPAEIGAGEGFLTKNDVDAVHVISKQNHWWNTPDWSEALKAIAAYAVTRGGPEIVTYGSSMGGHGALVASKPLGAARVVAYAPQFSVDPKLVPWEKRWLSDVKSIKFMGAPFADSVAATDCIFIFSDPFFEADQRHVMEISRHAPIRHLRVAFADHDVSRVLSDCGLLSKITLQALRGELSVSEFLRSYRAHRGRTALVYGGVSRLLHQRKHIDPALAFGRRAFEMLVADKSGKANAERDRLVTGYLELLVDQKRAEDALSVSEQWRDRRSGRHFVFRRLEAQALAQSGQTQAACDEIERAMAERPSERTTHTIAAEIFQKSDDAHRTLEFFQRHEGDLSRYPASIIAFVRLLQNYGHMAVAEQLLMKGAASSPKDEKAMKSARKLFGAET